MSADKELLEIIKKIKADAVEEFVNTMIGAFASGFVDKNNPTLQEIHRVAQNHVKDNYGVDMPHIVEQWGQDVTDLCSDEDTLKAEIDDLKKQIEALNGELRDMEPI